MTYDNLQETYRRLGESSTKAANSLRIAGHTMRVAYMSSIAHALKMPMETVVPIVRFYQIQTDMFLDDVLREVVKGRLFVKDGRLLRRSVVSRA